MWMESGKAVTSSGLYCCQACYMQRIGKRLVDGVHWQCLVSEDTYPYLTHKRVIGIPQDPHPCSSRLKTK